MYELIIENNKTIYMPVVLEEVKWSTERGYSSGKIEFKVVVDDNLKIACGNAVRFKKDGKNVFFGFIFDMKTNDPYTLTITAYDQLRYLKNKDTIVYKNKTASELLKMLINDFNLQAGQIDDTVFKIKSRVEDNNSLFDIIKNALDITLKNKKEIYILYDDFGKINLKNVSNMKLDYILDEDVSEKYDYSTSIDKETYNKIKIVDEDDKKSKRDVYISKSSENINKWGVLQFYEKLEKGENAKTKADTLLKLYNRETRTLKFSNALGDIRVRGGSLIIVKFKLYDVEVKNYMLVQKADHKFKDNEHFMDLTVIGGDFN